MGIIAPGAFPVPWQYVVIQHGIKTVLTRKARPPRLRKLLTKESEAPGPPPPAGRFFFAQLDYLFDLDFQAMRALPHACCPGAVSGITGSMPFTVATWNVNSLRKRLPAVARFTQETAVDVLCLQETKVTNELFPAEALADLGFPYQAIAGQKAYNGVAILSRRPLSGAAIETWCGRDDARHLRATVETTAGPLEVHSLYVPAGGDEPDPAANPKFAHKLDFLDALAPYLAARAAAARAAVVCGDLNVAPLATDVWSHARLKNVVTHTPGERRRLTALRETGGWIDALRRFVPEDEKAFTWWSYRAADWRAADRGRRLDHIWAHHSLAPALSHAAIHDETRDWPEPSDHAPVRAVFEFG